MLDLLYGDGEWSVSKCSQTCVRQKEAKCSDTWTFVRDLVLRVCRLRVCRLKG